MRGSRAYGAGRHCQRESNRPEPELASGEIELVVTARCGHAIDSRRSIDLRDPRFTEACVGGE